MATTQLISATSSISAKCFISFGDYRSIVMDGATVIAPKHTTLEPLGDRVLVKIKSAEETASGGILLPLPNQNLKEVAVAEERMVGGLYLTDASKEKPSVSTVGSLYQMAVSSYFLVAFGPGSFDDEGNRQPLPTAPGDAVPFSKYAGNHFKGSDGSEHIALRASDVMAILS
ncbi:20 kDa chaperonin, chloroplastic [Dorcoceras hygrometricum]|uniref:20 kDa chaperonin, chloroplastic n=1 Tax=Dorcoceras hygrometricum TaxID=472368 RepID=A0A2Z7AGP4_9LAMI|nr:20 kDa chaperonin, chloroplastic [Dorcoceras hygrometricum]